MTEEANKDMNDKNPELTDRIVALDLFGRLLMERVRDPAIENAERLAQGQQKGIKGKDFPSLLSDLSDVQREVLRSVAYEIVDQTLHYLLWFFEEEFPVDVAVTTERGVFPSLRDLSDGLTGEIYASDWIGRFSQHPLEE